MNRTVIFLLILLVVCVVGKKRRIEEQPTTYLDVTLDMGTYRGLGVLSHGGVFYYKFRGIRYAMPSTEYRRFEDAPPYNASWVGNKPVMEYGANCLGYDNYHFTQDLAGNRVYATNGEEDCLFINVHTPALNIITPVVFFIHGGGFGFGKPHQYSSHYIMDREVVFVNFSYRLGPLGFLSTGDKVVPGNVGLKDQLLALQWVNKYIPAFGGDKNKITITGVSAGGASAHFMYLSPLTTGLFEKGFTHSGTALSPWALFRDIPQKTRQLARYLSCPDSPSEKMVACLRLVNAKRLVTSVSRFKVFLFNPFSIFGPVVDIESDKPFLPAHPITLLNHPRTKDLPFITGVTAEDGLYPAAEFIVNSDQLMRVIGHWEEYLPSILFYKKDCNKEGPKNLLKALLKHRKEYGRSFAASFLQMISDRLYIIPALQSVDNMVRHNTHAQVRMYYFRYRGAGTTSERIFNNGDYVYGLVGHADDAGYIYNMPGMDLRKYREDRFMSDEMLDLLVTFTNKTTLPHSFRWWESAESNHVKYKYLDIIGPQNYTSQEEGSIFMKPLRDALWGCNL